jgi:spermidine/putrescine transport system substrate-binding protein
MHRPTRTLVMGLTALLASTAVAQAQGTLNLYNWGNFTPPELLEKFTAETGVTVTLTDFDSNDTALARIRQGGHGFDIVVATNYYVPIWIEEGLFMPLDKEIVTNLDNIAAEWRDVDFDPGRQYTVPWVWGTTGVIVNSSVYDGDPHTADIFLDPPAELRGRVNVIPEMSDIMHLSIRAMGGEPCTGDVDILRAVRDQLNEAKQHLIAMDFGTIDAFAAGDIAAGVYWNGSTLRARLQNPDIVYGYPQTGFPIWMDNAAVLADAQNFEEAMQFIDFILEPEHAAMISNFTRNANAVSGSEPYMDEVMQTAPEIVVPEDLAGAGRLSVTCPPEVDDIYTRIWMELLQ